MMQTVWLVRHAPTDYTGNRWAGSRSDARLNGPGRAIAERLATRLAPRLPAGTILVSSPSRRAVETAQPLATQMGTELDLDDDLREVDVGAAEGMTFDEAAERYPDLARRLLAADQDIDWPDGERAADLRERVRRSIGRLDARSADGTVVVVTHGGVIGEAIRALVGLEGAGRRWLEAGAAVALERDEQAWRLGDRLSADDA